VDNLLHDLASHYIAKDNHILVTGPPSVQLLEQDVSMAMHVFGTRGSVVVKALFYMPEGDWFETP
jgi:hypothetical protein